MPLPCSAPTWSKPQPSRKREGSRARAALAPFFTACLLALLSGCSLGQPEPEPGRTPAAAPTEGQGTLLVQNHSEKSVFHLRWKEAQASRWSGDRLDQGDVIKPGQDRHFSLTPGTYEVRLELGDGANWKPAAPLQVRPDVTTVCVLPGAPSAELGSLTVQNSTAWAIAHVRFSSNTEPGWGPERLPVGAKLLAGKARTWKVPAGLYQLQVEFQDGMTQDSAAYTVTLGQETVFKIGNIKRASDR